MLVRAACRVQQMILANHCGVGISEEEEGVAGFLGEITRNFWRIDADRYGTYARRLELR